MKLLLTLLLINFYYVEEIRTQRSPINFSPVILVPGDGGSQMEAKLKKDTSVYIICNKNADWYNLWLNLELLIPVIIQCWIDNMKLTYNPISRTTHNTNGVEVRIPGWGDPEVVEWIDPTHNKAGTYFKDIANLLVNQGYERKKSIRGAPYDFRKAPNELEYWFIDLKKLVEDTYDLNEKNPITFITHSMGSPMILVFLQQQTEEWKSKYVLRIISLAGAWAGSMKAIKVFAMGDDLDAFALSAKTLREEQITNPSTAWLLPSPLYWAPSEIIAETPNRIYTMANLKEFLNDVNCPEGWEMRKDNIKYSLNVSPPQVEIHCLYGIGLPTVERLIYKNEIVAGEVPILQKGNGDGTVNARSLRACKDWMQHQAQNVTSMEFNGVNHLGILNNKDVLEYIKKLLT